MTEMEKELEWENRRWAENPEPPECTDTDEEVIAECENCGEPIRSCDDSLAVVTADGKVAHWCDNCLHTRGKYYPENLILDILDAAGAFACYGWADENEDACRGAAERQKKAGVPAKRVLLIQRG